MGFTASPVHKVTRFVANPDRIRERVEAMKVEEYAEHLIRVIRHEIKGGRYARAHTLASNLAELLGGMTEKPEGLVSCE